jgi:hypothetical protein
VSTIAVDFDGVIHRYSKGWHDGTIYDPPVPGAIESLGLLMERFSVYIHTCRDPIQVARYLEDLSIPTLVPREHGGTSIKFWNKRGIILVTRTKLPAIAYIDDRAIRFESWERTLLDVARIDQDR